MGAEMYFVGQASGQRTVIQNIHVDQNQVNRINYEAHNTYHDNQNVHYMHNEENYHDGLDTPSIQSGDSYQDDVYDGSDTPSIQSGDSYQDVYYEDNFDDQYYGDNFDDQYYEDDFDDQYYEDNFGDQYYEDDLDDQYYEDNPYGYR